MYNKWIPTNNDIKKSVSGDDGI